MTRTLRALLGVAIVGILLLVWLLYVRTPAPSTPGGLTVAGPTRGGHLTATFRTEPESFNRLAAARAAGELFSRLTNATLIRINRVTQLTEPRLAESWTSSPDGLTWTLKLRRGVRFSDGQPFTSADVTFSFEAAITDDSSITDDLKVGGKPVEVTAPDEFTVVVRFPSPYAPGLRMFDIMPILPRHVLEGALKAGQLGRKGQTWNTQTPPRDLVGLGPFVLTEYVPGQRLVFARNPHFWLKDSAGVQLPYLEGLTIETVPDQNGEMLRLEAGQADLTTGDARAEDVAALRRDAQAGRVQLVEVGVGLDVNQLWFNLRPDAKMSASRRAWLQAVELRKAVSHGVDRQQFVNTVFLGAGTPVYGPVTPGNRDWYTPDIPTYPYNRDQARALLAAVGLTDRNGDGMLEDRTGAPARFSILTQQGHTIRERSVAVIQEQLRQVGLTVDVVTLDAGGLLDRYMKGDYDAMYFGIDSTDTDPSGFNQFWLSSGLFHFWQPLQPKPATPWEARIDELIARQEATLNVGERKQLFAEAQRLLAEHLPVISFGAPTIFVGMSPRVANATPALLSPQVLWNAEALAVQPSAPR